jgi:hypothetical protein
LAAKVLLTGMHDVPSRRRFLPYRHVRNRLKADRS